MDEKVEETAPLLPGKDGLLLDEETENQKELSLTEKTMQKSKVEQVEEVTGQSFDPLDFILNPSDIAAIMVQSMVAGAMAFAWSTFSVFIAREGGVPYSHYALFLLAGTIGGMTGPFFMYLIEDMSYKWIFLFADLFSVGAQLLFLIPFPHRFYFWCCLMFFEGAVGSVAGSVGMMYIGKCSGSPQRAIQFIAAMEFAETMSLLFMFLPGLILHKLGFKWFIIISALYEAPLIWFWYYTQADFSPNQTDLVAEAIDEYYTMHPQENAEYFAKLPVYSSNSNSDSETHVEDEDEDGEWEDMDASDYDDAPKEPEEEYVDPFLEMERNATPIKEFTWRHRVALVARTKTLIASSFTTGITETSFIIALGHFLATAYGLNPFEIGLFAIAFAVGMLIGISILMPFEESIDAIGAAAASSLFLGIVCCIFGIFYYMKLLTLWVCIVLAFGGGTFGAAAQVMISYVPFEVYQGKEVLIGTALVGTAYEIGDLVGVSMTPVILFHWGFGAMSFVSAVALTCTALLLAISRGR